MTTTVAAYLLERLAQVGCHELFGVPGDFNLTFLDDVEDHKQIAWIGCANELNAAYAADGYARTTGGLATVITTFGVGELSAVNGIAGAFSERVPVLHIVGTPSTKLQGHHAVLHHTLGDGRFSAYHSIAEHVVADKLLLTSADEAAEKIDRAICSALMRMRPTYLTLPTDLVGAKISSKPLEQKLVLGECIARPSFDPASDESLQHAVKQIVSLYEKAERPVVVVDACAVRFQVQKETLQLIEALQVPFFTSPMGKGAIDETHALFAGVYIGEISTPEIRDTVKNSDLVILVGALKSDFNTGGFSWTISRTQSVELHSDHTNVQYATYEHLSFRRVLPALTAELGKTKSKGRAQQVEGSGLAKALPKVERQANDEIRQDAFWPHLGTYLREGDVILAETGTSLFGVLDVRFQQRTLLIGQVLYGSIGYTGGAVLGACLAAQKQKRRVILCIGDGSMQLTVQEIGTLIRHNCKPIILLLNNDGYVIERQIHGPNRVYNDIARWDWSKMLDFFGATSQTGRHHLARTNAEFDALWSEPSFSSPDKLQLVEVIMDAHDAPRALREQAAMTEKVNAE